MQAGARVALFLRLTSPGDPEIAMECQSPVHFPINIASKAGLYGYVANDRTA